MELRQCDMEALECIRNSWEQNFSVQTVLVIEKRHIAACTAKLHQLNGLQVRQCLLQIQPVHLKVITYGQLKI
ncbi:hypothetical protein TYRP_006809 [Tyrophagus putrescentiae]|nr:hypothetical protein TYRP_006809 [Tyrophagus putrescentiae]